MGEGGNLLFYFRSQGTQFAAVGKLQFLMIAEVQFQFEQGGHLQEFFAQNGQFTAEMSLQLAECHLMCRLIGRSNQICHCLSLRKIHLAVHIGTTSIFARFCLATTYLYEALKNLLKNVSATMAGNLRGILARITVGRSEHAH